MEQNRSCNRASRDGYNRWATGCRVLLLLTLAFIAACTSRPDESEAIRAVIPQDAVDPQTVSLDLFNLRPAGDDRRHTVLALSSGGADGAFGAGVLAGWTANGTRPEFDVVTGVSTGALLAVYAFLGPQYDSLVKELYTTITNEKIFKRRGLEALSSDSLYDNRPFKEQIETHVTNQLLAKIAAEHNKGRRLYIATTNLDAGEVVIWDMGKIALGGRSNPLQHFQKVLRASATVPGYFKPVYIKPTRGVQLRQAHVDGGVKEPVLFENYMANPRSKEQELYMIINGTTRHQNATIPVEPNLQSISRKSITELIRELQRETIFRDYVNALNLGMEFYLTSIPDKIPVAKNALDFDPKRMNMLYETGYQAGLKGTANWFRRPPTLLKAEEQLAQRSGSN